MYVFIIVECCIAIVILMVVVALTASLRRRGAASKPEERPAPEVRPAPGVRPVPRVQLVPKVQYVPMVQCDSAMQYTAMAPECQTTRERLYDPCGLYAPISKEELALIDAHAKAYVEKQYQKGGVRPNI